LWREERDIEYRKGVDARATERTRKRILRERLANGIIIEDSNPLLVPVPDTEEIWWSQQPLERQVTRRRKRGIPKLELPSSAPVLGDDDLTITIDTDGDKELQLDYLHIPPLVGDLGIDSDSFNSDSSGDSDDSLCKVGDNTDSEESDSDYWDSVSSDDDKDSEDEEDL
jgi:hypothetical protein